MSSPPNPAARKATIAPEIAKFVAAQKGMVIATTSPPMVGPDEVAGHGPRMRQPVDRLLGPARCGGMVEASIEAGVTDDFPTIVSPEEATGIPREEPHADRHRHQGERRAASASSRARK